MTPPAVLDRLDVHDMVRELCDTTTHRQAYTRDGADHTDHHTISRPALILQLQNAGAPSGSAESGPRPAFGSKPSARLEALDTLTMIDHQSAQLLRELGHDDPGDTVACVRKVGSLIPSIEVKDRRKAVEKDIGRWWAWARATTGWDTPPWRPNSTCPLCGKRGTLRIRVAEHVAACVSCRQTWEPETIGLLADHIRYEAGEDVTP